MSDPALERLAKTVYNAGLALHRELGPGLLESVYETILADILLEKRLFVERQKAIPVTFRGRTFEEMFRADLIVENALLVELKSTASFSPVHAKQVLTYIRLGKLPLGFLMNFGAETFADGFRRLANDYHGTIVR